MSLFLLSLALSPLASAGSIVPILAPQGYLTAEALGVNASGQVAVTLYLGDFQDSESTTALYTPGVGYTNIAAGNGTGSGYSWANGIGKDGTIAGVYFPGISAFTAELLPAAGGHTNLPNLKTSLGSSQVLAINDSGIAVGSSFTQASPSRDHPVYWNASGIHDMGTISGGAYGRAFAINASGLVVGTAGAADDGMIGKAFTYQIPASGSATMTAISGLGTGPSDAYGVNNTGRIVGDHTVGGNLRAFSYYSGVVTELGTLGGLESWANAINSSAQIVGYSDTADGGAAFLYQNGQMIDLNSLLPENSGWHLDNAWGINDSGQIVGYGTFDGLTQGFLLNTAESASAPEPISFLLCGLGLAGVAVRKMRRA